MRNAPKDKIYLKLPSQSPSPKPPIPRYNFQNEKSTKYSSTLAENLKNKINEEFYKHLDKGDSVDIKSIIEEIEKIIKKHYSNNDKIKISIEPVNVLEFKIVIKDESYETN